MRRAFKLAYLGSRFHGYSRQPGLRTVEGDLLASLESSGLIEGPRRARFQGASRTDRGVSALGNVVAFDSSADPREVIARVNRRAADLWLTGYAEVPREFAPRKARVRWYRAFLPGDLDPGRVREGGRLFVGKHDFVSFSRGRQSGVCRIEAVEVRGTGDWTVLDIRGDRFLRGMVRRVARTLELLAKGELREEDVERGLQGDAMELRPAPPECLWLMDVEYGFAFSPFDRGRGTEDLMVAARRRALESAFLETLYRRTMGHPEGT